MNQRKPVTLQQLRATYADGERIAMLTCYDATFGSTLEDAGVDVLLVGDSLGMVLQGQPGTHGVTLDEITYHVRCVAQSNRNSWLIGDLPLASYHEGPEQAMCSASALIRAGAQMVSERLATPP